MWRHQGGRVLREGIHTLFIIREHGGGMMSDNLNKPLVLPQVTDLGRRLAGDHDGRFRAALDGLLDARLEGLERILASGLPPEESRKTALRAAAIRSARRIVEIVWHVQNAREDGFASASGGAA